MLHKQLSRLLGSGILLLVAATLALTACNSNSVSGSQPKASQATNAETKSSANPNGSRAQGLIGAAISSTR
jgi:hypothetical protein